MTLSVTSGDVHRRVRRHGGGGRRRQLHRNLDRSRPQAHAHRHQLLPGEPGRRRRSRDRLQHHVQLRLLAVQRLAVRSALLQVHPVHLAVYHVRQRTHIRRHRCRQVRRTVAEPP